MISALVFDCFGVLTTDAWLPFKQRHFGHDQQLFDEATDLNKQSDAGFITYQDFLKGVAALAKLPTADVAKAISNNVANEQLFAWIRQHHSYKLAVLSNAASNWMDELFAPQQTALFDVVSLSCETRLIKPDLRAYQNVAEQLGVPPEQCILVDDQERYCTGARDAGMQAVWFQNTEQCIAELDRLLASQSE